MSVDPATAPAPPTGPAPDAGRSSRRRRQLGLAVLAVVLVAVVVVLVVQGSRDEGRAAPGAAPSSDPAATASTSGAPTAATPPPGTAPQATDAGQAPVPAGVADPNEAPPSLPPVELDQSVPVRGVTASLSDIEAFTGEAVGPGNVNGPALRVTVRLQNDTDADLPLDGVAVDLAYGADRTPASPLEDRSQRSFAGTLPAGEGAEGVYVFSVPADAGDDLTISVAHQAGVPIAVFAGATG